MRELERVFNIMRTFTGDFNYGLIYVRERGRSEEGERKRGDLIL